MPVQSEIIVGYFSLLNTILWVLHNIILTNTQTVGLLLKDLSIESLFRYIFTLCLSPIKPLKSRILILQGLPPLVGASICRIAGNSI